MKEENRKERNRRRRREGGRREVNYLQSEEWETAVVYITHHLKLSVDEIEDRVDMLLNYCARYCNLGIRPPGAV